MVRSRASVRQARDSSLSGIFAGCVQAGRRRDDQFTGDATVTVVARWIPRSTSRYGTRMARDGNRACSYMQPKGRLTSNTFGPTPMWHAGGSADCLILVRGEDSTLNSTAGGHFPAFVYCVPPSGELIRLIKGKLAKCQSYMTTTSYLDLR
jgi:hypothetical protein